MGSSEKGLRERVWLFAIYLCISHPSQPELSAHGNDTVSPTFPNGSPDARERCAGSSLAKRGTAERKPRLSDVRSGQSHLVALVGVSFAGTPKSQPALFRFAAAPIFSDISPFTGFSAKRRRVDMFSAAWMGNLPPALSAERRTALPSIAATRPCTASQTIFVHSVKAS